MKQVLTVLALAAASCLTVPALAQTTTPGSGGGTGGSAGGGTGGTGGTGGSSPGAYTEGSGTFFTANAAGALEVPPNASPGFSMTKLEVGKNSMSVDVSFGNLISQASEAHIHCCTSTPFSGSAGVAVPFDNFPVGVTTGTYTNTFSLGAANTYDPGFLKANGGTPEAATTALLNAIAANEAYVNIHSTEFPNGEIRGWLVAAPIPEPAEWAMLGLGVGGLLMMSRRRRFDL